MALIIPLKRFSQLWKKTLPIEWLDDISAGSDLGGLFIVVGVSGQYYHAS